VSLRRIAIGFAAVAAVALPAATGQAAAVELWQSPSGNIRCAYADQEGIACYMRHNGRMAFLRSFGNSSIGWTRGSLRAGYVLGYGRMLRRSTFTCYSRTAGMECSSSYTGHGFFISRESTYRW